MNILGYLFFAIFMLSVIFGFWIAFWGFVALIAILGLIHELRTLYAHVRLKSAVEGKEEDHSGRH